MKGNNGDVERTWSSRICHMRAAFQGHLRLSIEYTKLQWMPYMQRFTSSWNHRPGKRRQAAGGAAETLLWLCKTPCTTTVVPGDGTQAQMVFETRNINKVLRMKYIDKCTFGQVWPQRLGNGSVPVSSYQKLMPNHKRILYCTYSLKSMNPKDQSPLKSLIYQITNDLDINSTL